MWPSWFAEHEPIQHLFHISKVYLCNPVQAFRVATPPAHHGTQVTMELLEDKLGPSPSCSSAQGFVFVGRSSRSQRNEWTLRQRNAHRVIWDMRPDIKRTKILFKIALSGWLKPGEFWSFHFDTVIAYSIFMYWKVGDHLAARWNPAGLGKQLLFKTITDSVFNSRSTPGKGKMLRYHDIMQIHFGSQITLSTVSHSASVSACLLPY